MILIFIFKVQMVVILSIVNNINASVRIFDIDIFKRPFTELTKGLSTVSSTLLSTKLTKVSFTI